MNNKKMRARARRTLKIRRRIARSQGKTMKKKKGKNANKRNRKA